ncbi:MAG: glycosyltransferase family 4 protein [Bacteroidota bacterium]
MKRILFLVAHRQGRSPGQRFRFEQYLGFLQQNGFSCEISFLLNEQDDAVFYSKGHYFKKLLIYLKSLRIRRRDVLRSSEFDLVFIYREALMTGSVHFERKMKKRSAKIVLDFDDAIWVPDVSPGNKNLQWLKKPSKTAEILNLSEMVFVGNRYLADYASGFNQNVKIIPSTIETDIFKRKHIKHSTEKICIGWTGSRTTMKHFCLALPVLQKIMEKFPGRIIVRLISDVNYSGNEIEVDFCKWNKESETDDLSEIDIGIMPLPDDEWARGKCGFKGLQYMSLEIPTIMSPVGVNSEIIQDGENGFLASTETEWIDKLSALIESPELREHIGKNGRKTVVEKYSYYAWKEKYLEYFEELLSEKDHS